MNADQAQRSNVEEYLAGASSVSAETSTEKTIRCSVCDSKSDLTIHHLCTHPGENPVQLKEGDNTHGEGGNKLLEQNRETGKK